MSQEPGQQFSGTRGVGQTEEPCPEDATLTARWSKSEVTPNHNSQWPPSDAPYDAVPEEAKVRMIADTTHIGDGTPATITIHHCLTDALIPEGVVDGLEVCGNQVVDRYQPCGDFEASPNIVLCENCAHYDAVADRCTGASPFGTGWTPPGRGRAALVCPGYADKPFVQCCNCAHFEPSPTRPTLLGTCTSDAPWQGSTEQGAASRKLCGSFSPSSEPMGLEPVTGGSLNSTACEENPVTTAQWGSLVRNTYVYHQTSHGTAQNGGSIALGHVLIDAADVSDTAAVPSVPRYLVYLNMCLAGKKPDLAKAFINRGTYRVLAFRVSIDDNCSIAFAKDFYETWRDYGFDPMKINQTFFETTAPYTEQLEPKLFHDPYGSGFPGTRPAPQGEG